MFWIGSDATSCAKRLIQSAHILYRENPQATARMRRLDWNVRVIFGTMTQPAQWVSGCQRNIEAVTAQPGPEGFVPADSERERDEINTRNFPRLTQARRQVLDRLLDQYLELEPDNRPAFVDRVRSQYPRLAHWFVPLADESRTTTSLLSRWPAPIAEELIDENLKRETPELEPGTRLGPWRITEFVGAGGMGKVYRGERADGAFEKEVAVKLIGSLRPGLADQLRQESHLLARLDHPTVTRLIDAGLTESDEPYLVMEWVEGSDLEDWLAANGVGRNQQLELFIEVARAVAHAHQRLIVHGDIKPGNIRVTSDGRIKLLDFGVARLLEDDARAGRIAALTPAFAAPEQVDGAAPTPASDVWALGALLNWILTGATPRHTDAVSSADAFPGQPVRGREITAIIDMACAPSPHDRYATVAGLLDDLERFRDHYPVRALPPGRGYRARKFIRRNPVMITGLAATFASLAGGLVLASVLYVQADSARQLASQEQQRAESRAEELEQVVRFQSEQLSEIDTEAMGVDLRLATLEQLDQAVGEAESSEIASEEFHELVGGLDFTGLALDLFGVHVFDRAVMTIDEQFEHQPLLAARLLQTVADTLHQLDQYERATELVRRALALREGLLGEEHPDTLDSIAALGRLLRDKGDYELAREHLDLALDRRRSVLGEDDPDALESLGDLASLLGTLGRYEEAEKKYRHILAMRRQRLGDHHPETAETLNNVGNVLHESGRMPEAETYYRQSLEIMESDLGENHSRTLRVLNNLGYLLNELGRYEEGTELLKQHLDRSGRVFGVDHPRTLRGHHNLAYGLQKQGDLQTAQIHYRKAYEGRLRTFGENHRLTLYSLSGVGHVLMQQGELEQATSYLRQALDISENVLGSTHHITFLTHHNIADLLSRSGDHEQALAHAAHATDGLARHVTNDHLHTMMARNNKAGILADLGRLDESLGYALLAWGTGYRLFDPWHQNTMRTLDQIIDTHDKLAVIRGFDKEPTPVMIAYWKLQKQLNEPTDERTGEPST